jgi:hypothetical protein
VLCGGVLGGRGGSYGSRSRSSSSSSSNSSSSTLPSFEPAHPDNLCSRHVEQQCCSALPHSTWVLTVHARYLCAQCREHYAPLPWFSGRGANSECLCHHPPPITTHKKHIKGAGPRLYTTDTLTQLMDVTRGTSPVWGANKSLTGQSSTIITSFDLVR